MPEVIEEQKVTKISAIKGVSVVSVSVIAFSAHSPTIARMPVGVRLATPIYGATRSEEDRAVEALGLEAFAADWESDADSIYDKFPLKDADLQ